MYLFCVDCIVLQESLIVFDLLEWIEAGNQSGFEVLGLLCEEAEVMLTFNLSPCVSTFSDKFQGQGLCRTGRTNDKVQFVSRPNGRFLYSPEKGYL